MEAAQKAMPPNCACDYGNAAAAGSELTQKIGHLFQHLTISLIVPLLSGCNRQHDRLPVVGLQELELAAIPVASIMEGPFKGI